MLAISPRSFRQKYIPRGRLEGVVFLKFDDFEPVKMRKVTASPADSGSVDDRSHLGGREVLLLVDID